MARGDVLTLERTAIGGHGVSSDALFELGLIYSTGRDVEADMVAAHKWFNLAALRGNELARSYRAEIAREMTKAQIAEAQRQAREWLATH
jgi:TPR repeat protein